MDERPLPMLEELRRLPDGLGWSSPDAIRTAASGRRARRKRRAVGAGVAAAVALTAAVVSAVVAPVGHPAAPGKGVAAGVRTVPLGGGAVHLVASVGQGAAAPAGAVAAVARGETGFALDLTRALARSQSPEANTVDSPLSAAVALSMLEVGAGGSTRAAIARALGVPALGPDEQAAAWHTLQAELARTGSGVTLTLANSVWATDGMRLRASFDNTLGADYDDAAYQADFGDPAAAAAAINRWVSGATHGHITQLFSPSDLRGVDAVLADALHFDAPWAVKMVAGHEAFTLANGRVVTVPDIAAEQANLQVARTGGVTAVAVPYQGRRYQALVVQPDAGSLPGFLAGLTPARLAGITDGLQPADVDLEMPSLDLAARQQLDGPLSALGMGVAFGPAADLAPMGLAGKQVSTVVQADLLQVTRAGTEADAATGIGIAPTAVRAVEDVTIDRPYLFLVRDVRTGAVVMAAAVEQPGAG